MYFCSKSHHHHPTRVVSTSNGQDYRLYHSEMAGEEKEEVDFQG